MKIYCGKEIKGLDKCIISYIIDIGSVAELVDAGTWWRTKGVPVALLTRRRLTATVAGSNPATAINP